MFTDNKLLCLQACHTCKWGPVNAFIITYMCVCAHMDVFGHICVTSLNGVPVY